MKVGIINTNKKERKQLVDQDPVYNLAFESIQTDSLNTKKICSSKVINSSQNSESFYLPQQREDRRSTHQIYRNNLIFDETIQYR